ncbi:MAG: hypothetical protein H8E94_05495 [Alphaproteobacteria bacterium]|nr:hypothetical protein [Alphaproteobacteria bacterium]MBL6946086.1 hypothetical protein [Rhodospirillales bacterium]
MKTLFHMVFLVSLVALIAPPAPAASSNRAAQQCRVDAGLSGDVHHPTFQQAMGMYQCIKDEIAKVGRDQGLLMKDFRKWRDEYDERLVAGGGMLAARSCSEEKNNRRYVEDRLGDVGEVRRQHEVNGEKFESLYQGFIFELSVVFLGSHGGADVLGKLIKIVNKDFVGRTDWTKKERKALQNFYVDLQHTRFQDACGGQTVRNTPPSRQCKWQTRRAFNAIRGRHGTTAMGYVCICPPADGRSVWPAANATRCGPYPSEAGGSVRSTPPAPHVPAPAGSGGGWTPVQ